MLAYFVGQRGVLLDDLIHYDVRYCNQADPAQRGSRSARNRAVIPLYMDGMMVGWQARYLGTPPDKFTSKYYTSPGTPKKQLLYDFDRARHKQFVVVVEGPTDVWAVGDYAVALLGKKASEQQITLLTRTWASKPIVVMLDSDANEEAGSLVESLLAARATVLPVCLPEGRDPGDLRPETVWGLIRAAARTAGVRLQA